MNITLLNIQQCHLFVTWHTPVTRTLPTIQDRMATLFLWFTLSREFALFTPLFTLSPPCFHWSSYVRDIASSFKARSWNRSGWGNFV